MVGIGESNWLQKTVYRIQIGDTDICQELYHTILEKENTCHRTCFRIYYQDLPLDHFTEIKNIPDIKNNAVFRIVEGIFLTFSCLVHYF